MRGGVCVQEYTYLNGTKKIIPKLNEYKSENYIKVNLPDIIDSGEEEILYAVVDDETLSRHNQNEEGYSLAMLLDDSIHYPGLSYGAIVPIELKKNGPPIVPFSELLAIYNRIPSYVKSKAKQAFMDYWKHM